MANPVNSADSTNPMNPNCPACGSTEVERRETKHVLPVPYGDAATWTEVSWACTSCGTQGDFAKSGHVHAVVAIKRAIRNSMFPMLTQLEKMGFTRQYIERALRLPPGSINDRWLRDDREVDPVFAALLRLVRTYPWLLQVSDANFDEKVVSLHEKPQENK